MKDGLASDSGSISMTSSPSLTICILRSNCSFTPCEHAGGRGGARSTSVLPPPPPPPPPRPPPGTRAHLLEETLALDGEARAPLQARHLLHQGVELVDLLVEAVVQRDHGGPAPAVGDEGEGGVLVEDVGVGAEDHEVVARLDGHEARPRDHHGPGVVEALDGAAHGRLELEALGRLAVAGVDRLAVADHREREEPAELVEGRLQRLRSVARGGTGAVSPGHRAPRRGRGARPPPRGPPAPPAPPARSPRGSPRGCWC